jgi:DNA-binding transcriptional ArsR family regulator
MSDSLPDTMPEETPPETLPAPAAPVSNPGTPAPAVAEVKTAAATAVEPLLVLKAIADPVRYRVLQLMARGEVLTVIEMAKRLKVHPDTMGKHVKAMRRGQLIRRVKSEGADGRVKQFQIAEACRPAVPEGAQRVLDFGCCTLRVD